MRNPVGTAFDIHGPLDAPVVVLIHGLGLNREVWDTLQSDLAPQYRVLRYDLLGHGLTPSPPGVHPTLALLSQQLADLMDYCRLNRAALIGFSLGGMIARHFAQTHPDRITALAILHSPHRRTAEAQAAVLARVAQARREGPASTVDAALARWFTDDFRQCNPAMMDRVRSWVLANYPATYHLYYRVLADGIDDIVSPDPPIRCPALVLTADQDYGNGPDMTRAIAAEIAAAETLIQPGLRHMALMEAPELTRAAIRPFLSRAVPRD